MLTNVKPKQWLKQQTCISHFLEALKWVIEINGSLQTIIQRPRAPSVLLLCHPPHVTSNTPVLVYINMESQKRTWKTCRADFNESGLEMVHTASSRILLTQLCLTVEEARKYSLTAKEAGKCSLSAKEAGKCSPSSAYADADAGVVLGICIFTSPPCDLAVGPPL